MTEPDVVFQVNDGVATLTLNRPSRLNALSDEMTLGAISALRELHESPEVKVLVLTGAGRAFCAGGDLGTIANRVADVDTADRATELEVHLRQRAHVVELIQSAPQITIAAVNGACAGAGMSLACASDLRFSTKEAVWNTAFLNVGLSGDFGLSWFLQRLIGQSATADLMLRPRKVQSERMYELGLVNEIYETDTFMDQVSETALNLAERSPTAVRNLLSNLIDSQQLELSEFIDLESARQVASVVAKPPLQNSSPQSLRTIK